MNFKNIIFFTLLGIVSINSSYSQLNEDRLSLADSLFQEKKYTQSFEIYSHLLIEQNKVTPAMLLKMAYIKEGLGDFSSALYYLNLYYLKSHNKRALKKMEDIAEKYELQGYEYTDFEFFMNIFYRYYMVFVIILGSLVFILTGYMAYKRIKLKENPAFSLFYLALVLSLFIYVVNFGKTYNKGIITTSNAYLMQGPSSGSGLYAVVEQGHRVKILGKEDIWVKILWDDEVTFIRENNITPISVN